MENREKTKEQLQEDLAKAWEEVAIQKWGVEKTLGGMKVLVKELIQKEKEAGEAKAEDEAIIASIGDGLVVVDKSGNVTVINESAQNMLGLTSKEIIGKPWIEGIQMEDEKGNQILKEKRPITMALFQSKTTTTTGPTYYYVRKDKTKFPVAITVTPVKLEGKIIGVIEVFRDITRETEVDKAKTEFLSLASHELRTPLTAIDGLVSMVLDGEYGHVNKELRQPLLDVSTSSRRLIHLVNDLLNLSRIEAGRLGYALTDFTISDRIRQIVKLLEPVAVQKGLKLQVGSLDTVTIQADPNKVEQIFDNLIGNALKFTDKGSITVLTKVVDDKVEVQVSDTGIGIAKEDQAKLFGEFQQLESSKEGRPAGTGLGLHISREMVRKMGGDLWIEKSEIGKGSTFVFSVPLAKSRIGQKIKKEINEEIKLHPDQKA